MKGYLLVNLGTPDSPSVGDVRSYLREFLSDPRVIDLSPLGRWMLLNFVILPFRPAKSAHAYQQIWGSRGSPLLFHCEDLRDAVAARLGDGVPVALGMRYGRPGLDDALTELVGAGCDEVVALPLFPQYSSAAWGSAAQRLYELAGRRNNVPSLRLVPPFWEDPGFVGACAAQARGLITGEDGEVVLMSYHGIPEHHCSASAPGHCFSSPGCCEELGEANRHCYRAQCLATSRRLADALDLADDAWEIAFQSRLGRRPWIRPYTDQRVRELAQAGVRRLVVLEPSFTADCLETLEEIGIRARAEFEAHATADGAELVLAPCVNATALFADAVVSLLTA